MSSDAPKRIAISFNSSTKPPPKTTSSTLGKRPRAGGFGDHNDSDSDSDTARHGRQEKITGFGADGAETGRKKEVKKEYVIAKQPNKDWRGEKRRQTSGLPGREQSGGDVEVDRAEADQDTGIKWGLTIKEKVKQEEEDDDVKQEPTSEDDKPPEPDVKKEEADPNDPDKEAMSALLGHGPSKPQAVIPSESDAYQRDINTTGEASTLEDYESMPVEEFGAALLRGMGWDGKERGTMRYKEVKRRPARLGLGAKELKGEEELGGWGQGKGGKKRPRLDEYKREKEKERERREARRDKDGDRRDRDRDRDYNRRRDDDRRRDRHRDDRDRRR